MKNVFYTWDKSRTYKMHANNVRTPKTKRKVIILFIRDNIKISEMCGEFGIKKPDLILNEEPKTGTKLSSKVSSNSISFLFKSVSRIRKELKKLKPKYVLYHGDTISTLIGCLSSCKLLNPGKKWKCVHIEAGLRSGSLKEPFPEEIIRIICDKFSDILLAVSKGTMENIKKYKKKKINFGNTVLDTEIKKRNRKEYNLETIDREKIKVKKKRGLCHNKFPPA